MAAALIHLELTDNGQNEICADHNGRPVRTWTYRTPEERATNQRLAEQFREGWRQSAYRAVDLIAAKAEGRS